MMKTSRLSLLMMIGLLSVSVLSAQGLRERNSVPLKNWEAPMYWQPNAAESKDKAVKQMLAGNVSVNNASDDITPAAQTPANSLVFVGMTPCRVVDTRGGAGPFGGPALIGGSSRTFPIQSSATCSIPSIAQAYSFNVTVVPNGFLDYITVWPSGQTLPLASTLNGYVGTVIANAAIVPAGTNGSVDVYASQNTHVIIDINGYYAPQSGITLAQGSTAAPSLSFAGDPGTGIFSSGTGALNVATGGTSRLTVRPDGDLDLAGSIRKGGTLFLHNLGTQNTGVGLGTLLVNTGNANTANGWAALSSNTTGYENTANGSFALVSNTTGIHNTANGYAALASNMTGNRNTANGIQALYSNTTGHENTANGFQALYSNTTGVQNTANGHFALSFNTTGFNNTAIGFNADVNSGNLINATAIGYAAKVDASNKIRLGNTQVTVLESQVGLTVVSDKNAKENFRPVNAEAVLEKVAGLSVLSWNYIGHDPKEFRHYGPMAQDFFAAFGEDELGRIGSPTTINSSDLSGILILAVQALEKRSTDLQLENEKLRVENRRLEQRLRRIESARDLEP